MCGHLETVRTLVELGVDKEAKDNVRNLMMMMMYGNKYGRNDDDMMILVDDKNDCR